MPAGVKEKHLEQAALGWFGELGYAVARGPALAPEGEAAERAGFGDVVLEERLRDALRRLNPGVQREALEEAFRQAARPQGVSLLTDNRAFHELLVSGVEVEVQREDGEFSGERVWLVDFAAPENNDWLVVNQFSVQEGRNIRRPDVVVFVNGLPLAVMELKNPADPNATTRKAFNDFQTYKAEIPSLFAYNESLVISDGIAARIGSLSADFERFMPWRTVEGAELAPKAELELEVLIRGVFQKRHFLDLIRYCTVFEDGGGALVKKMAAYHQFHAVRAGVNETLRACTPDGQAVQVLEGGEYYTRSSTGEAGDRRIGVVWHTQGSGKSLTMAFYAGWVALHPQMKSPTIVVITDRNDLDEQLFATFSGCKELLRQSPVKAESREQLRSLLQRAAGGVVFTTIQKFMPEQEGESFPTLSKRRNIVVISDEAHRSQYGLVSGFARHLRDALPDASFVGFTATPIERSDANTIVVFGDYISVYDIARATQDGATVPIYYESRLAQLDLDEAERPRIDPDFEEITEGEETAQREKLRSKWSALEAIAGTEKRIRLIAGDLLQHFDNRLETLEGKGMIVCMSRRICVQMFQAITALRPDWRDPDDERGAIKVVMTGSSSDPPQWQEHIRSKAARERLRLRFRNHKDPLKLVIVRDMWLTGFDAPCLHTMYVDKPMRGHGLMQAIARVNRVFRDKPGGLVVDYLGLTENLRLAMRDYTEGSGKGSVTIDKEKAIELMQEKYEVCCALLHGFDWSAWTGGDGAARVPLMPAAQDHILAQENGADRFIKAVSELSHAFALSAPHPAAMKIRDDLSFFQTVHAALAKTTGAGERPGEEMEHAIRQLVSRAIAPEGVVDIFAAAGLGSPDISILSDEFLAEVQHLPQRNLAVELLHKLLRGEIGKRRKKNIVQARSFAAMLENSLHAYRNRTLGTAEVIEQLIELARKMREAQQRGEDLGLNEDESAFYDALADNESAVEVLGSETLGIIARELVSTVRRNTTLDWTHKESVRARLRLLVKRILQKYGYPPDKQEQATRTVLEQAEALSAEWASEWTAEE